MQKSATKGRAQPRDTEGAKQPFSSAEVKQLCICGCCDFETLDAAALTQKRYLSREWRQHSRRNWSTDPESSERDQLVLQQIDEICRSAAVRRQSGGETQILILLLPGGKRLLQLSTGREPTDFHKLSALAASKRVFLTLLEICDPAELSHQELLFMLAAGFDQVWLQSTKVEDEISPQRREVSLAASFSGRGRIFLFSALTDLLSQIKSAAPLPRRDRFRGGAKGCSSKTVWEMVRILQPEGTDQVVLPNFAPYGHIRLQEQNCNMCRACVWLCPTGALGLSAEDGRLTLTENSCVQCGICVSACSQKALDLTPALSLQKSALEARPLKTSMPSVCSRPSPLRDQTARQTNEEAEEDVDLMTWSTAQWGF